MFLTRLSMGMSEPRATGNHGLLGTHRHKQACFPHPEEYKPGECMQSCCQQPNFDSGNDLRQTQSALTSITNNTFQPSMMYNSHLAIVLLLFQNISTAWVLESVVGAYKYQLILIMQSASVVLHCITSTFLYIL